MLARLQGLVERGRSEGQAILVSGAAGAGKSALVGALIAALLRPLFIELRFHQYLWPVALVYGSLAVLMTCVVYLVFFNRIWG